MKQFYYLLLLIISVLPACSSNSPIINSPTSPPPTATIIFTPTPVSLDISSTKRYTHTRFSIDYPADWSLFEKPNGTLFIDESGSRAGYSVFFKDMGQFYSQKEINQYMITFVAENFVNDTADFSVISETEKDDGSVEALFTALDPNLGQTINEVRVFQVDTVVFILLTSITQEYWGNFINNLHTLTSSFTPLDTTTALATVEPIPTEPPMWVLTGPTSNMFGFIYPNDWDIVQQDENTVLVAMPNNNISFEAATFEQTKTVKKEILAYRTALSEKHTDIRNMPPSEFPLGDNTGLTVDYLYINEDGKEMAGSIIMISDNNNIYRVIFTAPVKFYEGALQWFNPMYKSFTILNPNEELPLIEQVK